MTTLTVGAGNIIHDAEHYILEAQHGKKWAAEDKTLDQRLAQLREEFGMQPNIIHIYGGPVSCSRGERHTCL